MASASSSAAPVLVTGISGFVGSHTMVALLEAGYSVRGTVRSDPSAAKYDFVREAAGAHVDRLELVVAGLLDEGSYDAACEGCEVVMHIASPYSLTTPNPQQDLVDPAVNGTLNVLGACTRSSTTRRVIVTSSVAAVADEFSNNKEYDENDWNETSDLVRNPYYFSKVCAERAAHEYVKETDPSLSLAVINPFVILGPALDNRINSSVSLYQSMLQGKQSGIVELAWGIVDVRDVALAHVRAMERPETTGRHIVCHGPHTYAEVAGIMHRLFPEYPVPTRSLPTAVVRMAARFQDSGTRSYLNCSLGRVPRLNAAKAARELGIDSYIPLEKTLEDMGKDLIAKGLVREPCRACVIQ